jgi:para-aminobenzoate synthetase component 1
VVSILAADAEVEFRGGREALVEALHWLRPGTPDRFEQLLIGYLAYDLGRAFERIPEQSAAELEIPDVCLSAYRAVYVYDSERSTGRVLGSDPVSVRHLEEQLHAAVEASPPGVAPRLEAPQPRTPTADYLRAVDRVRDWIRAGDVYQVNLSRRLDFEEVPPDFRPSLYAELVRTAPAPFCAFLEMGDHAVISNSPERFLRVSGDRVETCPIKGTRPRGRTPEEDRWLAKELCASEKDRAEHVMIVDLERNDLGRVCQTGSVHVPRLGALRSFPTVHHLVSSVVGELRDPGDVLGLLTATFPGGSITGAPKIRAMEIIEGLEPVRRGIYTGAIGYIDASGELDLSIAIRTAVAVGSRLTLHVGGGIVADSEPEAELRETEDKAEAFARLCASSGLATAPNSRADLGRGR